MPLFLLSIDGIRENVSCSYFPVKYPTLFGLKFVSCRVMVLLNLPVKEGSSHNGVEPFFF